MPTPVIPMLKDILYKTKRGFDFEITLSKKQLTSEHNYWLYFINAKHSSLGNQGFTVFITKQAFPNESDADHLASTLAIDKAKSLLEEADENGRPLRAPLFIEGWALL